MKLEEYQAKDLLRAFNLPLPTLGGVVENLADLPKALEKTGTGPWVIKAQVQTGGRGKAGGVKIVKTAEEAKAAAEKMLGMKLVTVQTGPEGLLVERVLVERASLIKKELYLSIVIDRKRGGPTLIASAQGGMDIEELAETAPEAILKFPVNPERGLLAFEARQILKALGLLHAESKVVAGRVKLLQNFARAFLGLDASLLEINPLAIMEDESLLCVDAKLVVDENALFRHPEMKAIAEAALTLPAEKKAHEVGIAYIPLEGSIGCMVNGAGLAMATMDIIKQYGGSPANFLDVGGGAKVEQVTAAFKIILSDKNVRAILVNIFGGIMRCDVIAEGIVIAAKEVKLNVPLVVRLQGNRVEEGRAILKQSALNIVAIDDLALAAQKAVELSKKS